MTFITILTPVYNGVEFLEECINSVLAQTYNDWALFIGINGHGDDGGSAAHTIVELAKKDSRIHVFIQKSSIKGKVDSLNDLMTHVSSPWVCVLDCDDKWAPDKLMKQCESASGPACDAAVIGTFCRYFGELDYIVPIPSKFIDPVELTRHNPIINSSSMIRKEYAVWENGYIGIEDYKLWMTIVLNGGKLYNISEVLTYHRIHKSSSFNSKGYSNETIRADYAAKLRKF
jgi:glycosyltransferase involved in cell wall biosynthesis